MTGFIFSTTKTYKSQLLQAVLWGRWLRKEKPTITVNQANTVVQLAEDEAKRVAEEAIKSYNKMCKTASIVAITMGAAYTIYVAYDLVSDYLARRRLRKTQDNLMNMVDRHDVGANA